MVGIYKFTNLLNGKCYIGKSQNLENRYKSHERNYQNSNLQDYNTKFYRALRKYGFQNFKYEILEKYEKIEEEELNNKEKYYIKKYNALKEGYNIQEGGKNTAVPRKLDEEQIIEIKKLLLEKEMSFKDISNKYSVSESLISMINAGETWTFIGNFNYPIRTKSIQSKGEKNPKSKITDQEVLFLREYFVTHTLDEVYEKFGQNHSFSEIKKICYGVQFKHLPAYKKRLKKWFLNDTCIDYPREVE